MGFLNIISKIYTCLITIPAFIISLFLIILNILHLLGFFTIAYIVGFIPGRLGVLARRFWYKLSLKKCGKKLHVEFGAVIIEKESEVGNNVYIGPMSHIDLAKIGDDALISQGVVISGAKNAHGMNKNSIMRLQEGHKKKIIVGNDVWMGMHAVIMEDVNDGCIIASMSLVNKKFEKYSIIAGIPGKIIRKRK